MEAKIDKEADSLRHIRAQYHGRPLGHQTNVRAEHMHSAKRDEFNDFIESQSKRPIPEHAKSAPNKNVRVVTV